MSVRYCLGVLIEKSVTLKILKIFDCFIKDNQKWLEYEVISLEYVLDKETGKVRKRTLEELYALKENSKYSDYIELLINKINSKNVSRSM